MANNSKELTRAWTQTGLDQAWGPHGEALYNQAVELEEKNELFGGVATKITVAAAAISGSCGTADAHPGAAPAAKGPAKAKPAAKPKAQTFVRPYGCSRCRYAANGCLACNPDKKAKWLQRKADAEAAEQEDAKQLADSLEEYAAKWEAHEVEEATLGVADETAPPDPAHADEDCDSFLSEGALCSDAKAILDSAFASCHGAGIS